MLERRVVAQKYRPRLQHRFRGVEEKMSTFESITLSPAPDGSGIRPVSVAMTEGNMVHCTLKPGEITKAVQHRTVAETWLCISCAGRLWRSRDGPRKRSFSYPGRIQASKSEHNFSSGMMVRRRW
jgi:mannose-6-phosphate isomerase-like protein (cupin superfamily)